MNEEAEEYLNKVMMPLLDPRSIDDEGLPIWVRNIIKHFHGTGVKTLFEMIKNKDFDPHGIGLLAGFAKHIETIPQSLPGANKDILEQVKGTEFEKILDQAEVDFDELKEFTRNFEDEISKGTNHEESKYLKGKSEGLQLIRDEKDQIKGARENTKLLAIMYFVWPFIEEQCKTRRELYEFLLKNTWRSSEPEEKFNILMVEADPPSFVGSYERVERVLRRIGFNPAVVGRPRKNRRQK